MHGARPDMRPHRLVHAVARPDRAVGEADLAADGLPALRAPARLDVVQHRVAIRHGKIRRARCDRRQRGCSVVGRDQPVGDVLQIGHDRHSQPVTAIRRGRSAPRTCPSVVMSSSRNVRSSARRRTVQRLEAELVDLLPDLGHRADRPDLGRQLLDDVRRRVRRRHDHVPVGCFVAGNGVRDRRNVGEHADAVFRRHPDRANLSGLGELRAGDRVGKQHLDVSGDDVVHRRRGAAVVRVSELDAGHVREQLAGEMRRGRNARRADDQLAGLVLGVFDQLGDRMHRQRRIDHQREGDLRRQRDRHEVLARIVGQVLVNRDVGGERPAGVSSSV